MAAYFNRGYIQEDCYHSILVLCLMNDKARMIANAHNVFLNAPKMSK